MEERKKNTTATTPTLRDLQLEEFAYRAMGIETTMGDRPKHTKNSYPVLWTPRPDLDGKHRRGPSRNRK